MANVGDLAVKGGKAVIKFMLELITEFLKSEEFKKQMKFMIETLVTKVVDKVIGSVDFNHRHEDDVLEIGYILHPDYWGRGYVPEAARTLIDLAFTELNLHKIELSCFSYNLQSQRVAEKLGFTLEARIRDRKDAQGNRCDDLRYGLLKSEWGCLVIKRN